MARDFKKIKAWQLTNQLAIQVYKVTKNFPKEELYGVVSQLRRSAVSSPTNIVEGSARNSKKEYLYFLYIARGSLVETQYLLFLSNELGYLSNEIYHDLEKLREECSKTLHGLIKAVNQDIV